MKKIILLTILLAFHSQWTSAQQCNYSGCTNATNQYPTGQPLSTTSSSWQLVSSSMNAGNYTLFNVVATPMSGRMQAA